MWNLIYSNCFIHHNGNLTNVPDSLAESIHSVLSRKDAGVKLVGCQLANATQKFTSHAKTKAK